MPRAELRLILLVLASCASGRAKEPRHDASLAEAEAGVARDGAAPPDAPRAAGDVDTPAEVGEVIEFRPTPPPDLESYGYPKAQDGTYVVGRAGDLELRIDPETPPNPMSVRVSCTDWLTQCAAARGNHRDDCFRSVPRCATDRPWEEAEVCCPASCLEAYVSARKSGVSDGDAWLDILGGGDGRFCFPGYQAWLDGEDP